MRKVIAPLSIAILGLIFLSYGFQRQTEFMPQEKHEVVVRLILVDVIVTKDGEFVRDLKREDFELYEDGKRIPINSFELMSFEERKLEISKEIEEKRPPDVPRKKLIVLFDGINSWGRDLKQGIEKIVDELTSLAKLGNEVMVLQLGRRSGLEMLQPFTTHEELIRKAVSKAAGSVWSAGQELTDFRGMASDLAAKSLVQEYLRIEKQKFEITMGGILAVLSMIKSLPGRKSILFISSGIPDISSSRSATVQVDVPVGPPVTRIFDIVPHDVLRNVSIFDPFNILKKKYFNRGDEVIKEMIRFANVHNISVYSLDPETFTREIFTGFEMDYAQEGGMDLEGFLSKEKIMKLQNLTWLSEDTGAVALKGGKKYEKFRQVMNTDLNYYYQLSFYPKRKDADDKYHSIKVEVKRGGIDVRFRKGYTDYSEKESNKMLLVSAYYNPDLYKSFPLKAEVIPFYADSGKFEPWIGVAFPTKELFLERFIELGPKTFNLYIWMHDRESGDKGFEGQINIPLSIDSSFMDDMKTIEHLNFYFKGPEMDYGRREYQAVIVLFDPQTDDIGALRSSFSLSDFKQNTTGAIINCVLGSVTSNPEKRSKTFSLSDKDGSLEFGEIKFFPLPASQFSRGEDVFIFIQTYLPKGKIEIRPDFVIIGEDDQTQSIPGLLMAESWNKRLSVWSAIFRLDLGTASVGNVSLKVGIPLSEEGPVLEKQLKLMKLPQ